MTAQTTRSPSESTVTLRQLMLPEHANMHGNVHGGVVMKMMDEAGAIAAMRHARRPCVTVSVDSIAFHSPVHVGALLGCQATVTWAGRTSMEVRIEVNAEDSISGTVEHTNSAHFVYVALDPQGKPTEVPALRLETDAERAGFREAEARRAARIASGQR